ncbi:MAG: hypothetical protein KIT20_10005 [Alphaproteobacteria bacterium]|nr:hypothetical protein [Alphaproteobacteria bacterium]
MPALALALPLMATAATGAAAGAAECSRALQAPHPARLAVARILAPAQARVNFLTEGQTATGACPEAGAPACAMRAYLLARDLVVTGIARGAHVCAAFVSPAGRQTTGWLPATSLSPVLEPAHPAPGWWQGMYRGPAARLTVEPEGEGLRAALRREGRPDIQLAGRPDANEVLLREEAAGDCTLVLRLVADYLIADKPAPGCGLPQGGLFRKQPE